MKTKEEIYKNINNNILSNINEEWIFAILKINVSNNFSSYEGYYIDENHIKKKLRVSNFDWTIDTDLLDLNRITTMINNEIEKWNVAYYKVYNNGKSTMDYIWDQVLYDFVYNKDSKNK